MTDDLEVKKGDWKKLKHGILHDKIRSKGYKINTWLVITIAFFIPILIIIHLGMTEGFTQKWSVTCPEESDRQCQNPFNHCDIMTTSWCPDTKTKTMVCNENPAFCSMPLLVPGLTYGHKKGFLEKNFFWITALFLFLAYGINHVIYNSPKDRKKRMEEYEHEREK